jgi:hypothetical protein
MTVAMASLVRGDIAVAVRPTRLMTFQAGDLLNVISIKVLTFCRMRNKMATA